MDELKEYPLSEALKLLDIKRLLFQAVTLSMELATLENETVESKQVKHQFDMLNAELVRANVLKGNEND